MSCPENKHASRRRRQTAARRPTPPPPKRRPRPTRSLTAQPYPTAPSTHLATAPGPPFPREQLTESQAENEKLKQDLIDAEAGCSSCCVLSSSGDTDSVVLLTLVYVVTCERRRAGEAVGIGAGGG